MKQKKILLIIFIIIGIIGITIFSILYIHNENELALPEEITTDEKYENIKYTDESSIEDSNIVGFLNIEKIELRAKVKVGCDNKTLQDYIGIIGTNTYDGNVCLAGHNRGYENSYFARLNELQENDVIVYETNFFTRKYKVTEKKVIKETDLSVLENSKDNKLTLITCITNKRSQRLCIVAEEIIKEEI